MIESLLLPIAQEFLNLFPRDQLQAGNPLEMSNIVANQGYFQMQGMSGDLRVKISNGFPNLPKLCDNLGALQSRLAVEIKDLRVI